MESKRRMKEVKYLLNEWNEFYFEFFESVFNENGKHSLMSLVSVFDGYSVDLDDISGYYRSGDAIAKEIIKTGNHLNIVPLLGDSWQDCHRVSFLGVDRGGEKIEDVIVSDECGGDVMENVCLNIDGAKEFSAYMVELGLDCKFSETKAALERELDRLTIECSAHKPNSKNRSEVRL